MHFVCCLSSMHFVCCVFCLSFVIQCLLLVVCHPFILPVICHPFILSDICHPCIFSIVCHPFILCVPCFPGSWLDHCWMFFAVSYTCQAWTPSWASPLPRMCLKPSSSSVSGVNNWSVSAHSLDVSQPNRHSTDSCHFLQSTKQIAL